MIFDRKQISWLLQPSLHECFLHLCLLAEWRFSQWHNWRFGPGGNLAERGRLSTVGNTRQHSEKKLEILWCNRIWMAV